MYLNEPLLKAVSAGSAGRFLKEGESLRSQPLGELYLPTGKIVANDPCCLFEGTPFTRTVPPFLRVWHSQYTLNQICNQEGAK